ncbi:hypothetical protein C1645_805195 [Glomus cerebriforme]|uniref:Uncharacterized protein n=1 Tax=Glomus cerebriforme TaxID=658196 RepID=A0A397T0U8_9GLOM|nr:hypothetical protein C1645_805195 [Glomus cerebriforme]
MARPIDLKSKKIIEEYMVKSKTGKYHDKFKELKKLLNDKYTVKEIRDCWNYELNPELCKDPLSTGEIISIKECVKRYSKNWTKCQQVLKKDFGRLHSINKIKTAWQSEQSQPVAGQSIVRSLPLPVNEARSSQSDSMNSEVGGSKRIDIPLLTNDDNSTATPPSTVDPDNELKKKVNELRKEINELTRKMNIGIPSPLNGDNNAGGPPSINNGLKKSFYSYVGKNHEHIFRPVIQKKCIQYSESYKLLTLHDVVRIAFPENPLNEEMNLKYDSSDYLFATRVNNLADYIYQPCYYELDLDVRGSSKIKNYVLYIEIGEIKSNNKPDPVEKAYLQLYLRLAVLGEAVKSVSPKVKCDLNGILFVPDSKTVGAEDSSLRDCIKRYKKWEYYISTEDCGEDLIRGNRFYWNHKF